VPGAPCARQAVDVTTIGVAQTTAHREVKVIKRIANIWHNMVNQVLPDCPQP
jgi:hypothetical protein